MLPLQVSKAPILIPDETSVNTKGFILLSGNSSNFCISSSVGALSSAAENPLGMAFVTFFHTIFCEIRLA